MDYNFLRNLAQKTIGDTPAPEGQDYVTPTSSPIDLVGAGLGGMAAKGLMGAAGGLADTSGAMLARKAALQKMGAGSIADSEAATPIAQLGEDVTKTIAPSSGTPVTADELAMANTQVSNRAGDLTGKGTEYLTDMTGNPTAKFINGNLEGSSGAASHQLPTSPTSLENGDAILQGIKDKIARANQNSYGAPKFGQLKQVMGSK